MKRCFFQGDDKGEMPFILCLARVGMVCNDHVRTGQWLFKVIPLFNAIGNPYPNRSASGFCTASSVNKLIFCTRLRAPLTS
jgi:hypothetical protein